MNWNKPQILKVINVVMTQQNTDYKEVNKQLEELFGVTNHSVICTRVSIMRVLQGFESTKKATGLKKGFIFGPKFPLFVNEWFNETYKGGLSRIALSHKFD